MSKAALLATTFLYFTCAIGLMTNRPWMAGAILCYGIANICLVMDIR